MSNRLYKKQAKRGVELLRSHGIDVSDIVIDPYSEIRGLPCRWHQTSYEYDEWDTQDTRNEWIDFHYWNFVVTDGHFKTGDEEWPSMTLQQRRERFSVSQLAPGWRFRGGRAIQISKGRA